MKGAPPLRFLALVIGSWACIRAAMLAPGWRAEPLAPVVRSARTPSIPVVAAPQVRPTAVAMPARPTPAARPRPALPARRRADPAAPTTLLAIPFSLPHGRFLLRLPSAETGLAGPLALARPLGSDRWSGSAWLLVRRDRNAAAFAPGGTLGGSQAGARIVYRHSDDVALSARAYLPLRRTPGAEAAIGLDWRPSSAIAFHVLAERRQALGDEGRSAFALTLYGGGGRSLAGGLRAEGYAQAGIVGARSRDLFVDASLRLGIPIGPVEAGAGAWGAAQPGAARLDAGPQASVRLPVAGATMRLRADWRFRIAGEAAPGSGPALTLAADF